MKNYFKATVLAVMAGAVTGCNSDNLTLEDNTRYEQYVHNFIRDFGVPDPDHNYAMSKSAGLQVTTKKGGHVTVTAEVGGTEYLFADLDVPAGVTKLPVTLPASVNEVNIVTYNGILTVGINDIVDIDTDTDSPFRSRVSRSSSTGNSVVTFKGSGDGKELYITWSEDKVPYLAFKPEDFLLEYLAKNPSGNDNTDYELKTKLDRGPDGNKTYTVLDPAPNNGLCSHETVFNCSSKKGTFYVFPIYWRKTKDNKKDFQLMLHRNYDNYDLKGNTTVEFGDPGQTTATTPFPNLGYSNTITDRATIDIDNLEEQFEFDNGNFTEAFDPATAKMVISRGIKVVIEPTDRTVGVGTIKPAISLALSSGHDSDGYPSSFVSSSPFYNTTFWGGNYFDVSIHNLYLAQAATKSSVLTSQERQNIYLADDIDKLIENYKSNFSSGTSQAFIDNQVARYIANLQQEGQFVNYKSTSISTILGFNPPPSRPGDTSPRDYGDVLFLITPYTDTSFWYTTYCARCEKYEWTIAAEDLGGSDDWDFNDAVFTFTDVIENLKTVNHFNAVAMIDGPAWAQAVRVIRVTPKAAGGILPIYITYTGTSLKKMPNLPSDGDEMFSKVNADLEKYLDDKGEEGTFIIGCELHKWLGGSVSQMINTGENRGGFTPRTVEFVIPTNLDVDDEDILGYYDGLQAASKDNQPLFGFSVLVDKNNELKIDTFNDKDNGFCHIPSLKLGQDYYLISAPSNNKNVKVPQMILVQGDWEWPSERTNIMDAYPNFSEWIKDHTNTSWHTVSNKDNVTKK